MKLGSCPHSSYTTLGDTTRASSEVDQWISSEWDNFISLCFPMLSGRLAIGIDALSFSFKAPLRTLIGDN